MNISKHKILYYIKHVSKQPVPVHCLWWIPGSHLWMSGSPPGKMYLLTNALVKQLMMHNTSSPLVSSQANYDARHASAVFICIRILRLCLTEVQVSHVFPRVFYQKTTRKLLSKWRPVQVTLWFQGPRRAQPMVWIIMMPSSCMVQSSGLPWHIMTVPVQPANIRDALFKFTYYQKKILPLYI